MKGNEKRFYHARNTPSRSIALFNPVFGHQHARKHVPKTGSHQDYN
jgi:hypothetical protein